MAKIQGLKTLKGYRDLSRSEKAAWLQKNSAYIPKTATTSQIEQFYNTQRFINNYGVDTARKYTYAQRLAIEQDDLQKYNNSLINKETDKLFNVYREDGTLDLTKGMGDEEMYLKAKSMSPQNQERLIDAYQKGVFRTLPDLNKYIDEEKKKKQKESTEGIKGFFTSLLRGMGSGAAATGGMVANPSYTTTDTPFTGDADQQKILEGTLRDANTRYFNKIYNDDLAEKIKQTDPYYKKRLQEYDKLSNAEVQKAFIERIFPDREKRNLGIPQLAAFFNKDGSIREDAVEKLDSNEKRKWLAKMDAYNEVFPEGTAYDMLDKEAKDYLHEHQSNTDYWLDLGKSIAIGMSSYAADYVNGLRGLYISARENDTTGLFKYDTDKVPVWQGKDGHLYSNQKVQYFKKKGKGNTDIYVDPYTGQEIPVTLQMLSRSALDKEGIDEEGNERDAFFNNRYWSDAEATNMWTREEHARAKSLNGYSSSNPVYKLGEEKDYAWDTLKMLQFAIADMALAVPIGGIGALGKTMSSLNYVKRGGLFAQELTDVGRLLRAVGASQGTLGAASIGHAYGRGKFAEMIEGNVTKIDDYLRNGANERFHKQYTEDEVFKRNVDNRAQILVYDFLNKNRDYIQSLSKEEQEELLNQLHTQAMHEVANQYMASDIKQMKEQPEYDDAVTEGIERAASSANIASYTTGIKYALVNNFGYRQYLYKDPVKRVSGIKKNLLNNIKEGPDGKLSFSKTIKEMTKPQKLSMAGKVLGKQFYGGAWTNFTDEMQSAGAAQINDDKMGDYLRGHNEDFGIPEVMDSKISLYGNTNALFSYLLGAYNNIDERNTWDAGLVGGLGSIISVTPNLVNVYKYATSRKFREEISKLKEKGASKKEIASMFVKNGILNDYYDKYASEREVENAVEIANKALETLDGIDDISKVLGLELASKKTTDINDRDALDFVRAAMIAKQLKDFEDSEDDDFVLSTLRKSSVYSNAVNTVDKILSDKFTDKEAEEFLTEYYTKNPSVDKTEENNAKALETIKDNAQKMKRGIEIYQKVSDLIKQSDEQRGTVTPSSVVSSLVERFALDEFLNERIPEIEERISGSSEVAESSIKEAYGTDKAIEHRINEISNVLERIKKGTKEAEAFRNKLQKEADDYIEERDGLLTTEEQNEYAVMLNKVKAADMQVELYKAQERALTIEGDKLISMTQDGVERRVITADEILRLSPTDRARMLNKANFNEYSKQQQAEIDKAKEQITLKDPNLINDIFDIANMVQRKVANAKAYEMMFNNPKAAAAQLDSQAIAEASIFNESLTRRRAQTMSDLIDKFEKAPDSTQESVENQLYETLLNSDFRFINDLKEVRDFNDPLIKKYSSTFDKAIERLSASTDIRNTIDSLDIDDNQKMFIHKAILDIMNKSANKQEFADNLAKALTLSDNSLSSSDMNTLQKVYDSLMEKWSQDSAIKPLSNKQRKQIEKQKNKRIKKEAERKAKAEAEAKAKAEKDNKSHLTEKDTNKDKERAEELAKYNLTEEDLDTNNEHEYTEEELTTIRDSQEGMVDLIESPTIEEQAKEAPKAVQEIVSPTESNTIESANKSNSSSSILIGNPYFRYTEDMKINGEEKLRPIRKEGSAYDYANKWLDENGVNLQRIVDDELYDISQTNPDVHIMYINPNNTIPEYKSIMQRQWMLVVEYTPEISRIHNNDNGGVFQANDKQWLLIGMIGYNGNAQQEAFFKISDRRGDRTEYFNNNPGEKFFISPTFHTKIAEIGGGWKVLKTLNGVRNNNRRLSELADGKISEHNPKGYSLNELKWYIQQGDKAITVNVDEDRINVRYDRRAAENKGKVFFLIQAADGSYIPGYINPVTYSELPSDSNLIQRIDELFNELTSTDHSKRVSASKELSNFIVLKKEVNDINIGFANERPKLTITSEGVKGRDYYLDSDFDREALFRELRGVDFRINITQKVLSNEELLSMYDEAGALTTNIAKLGTSNASFSIYTMGEDGNPIINESINTSTSNSINNSDLNNATQRNPLEYVNNTLYELKDGKWYDKKKNSEVTDVILKNQIKYKHIIRVQGLKPSLIESSGDTYIISNDRNNPIVVKRTKGSSYIQTYSKDASLVLLDRIEKENIERTKQERLIQEAERKKQQEKANDEALEKMSEEEKRESVNEENGAEEVFLEDTGEELLRNMQGNFSDRSNEKSEEEALTEQQKASIEVVEKIMSKHDTIHLEGDVYVDDSDGAVLDRVTTVIGADEKGSVFGLPKNSHAETIDGKLFAVYRDGRDYIYYWINNNNKLMGTKVLKTDTANITAADIKSTSKEVRESRNNYILRDIRNYLENIESPWILPSTTLGTGVHNFIEAVINNTQGNPENYEERFPNMTNSEIRNLAIEAQEFKNKILDKYDIVGTEVKIRGTVEVQDPTSDSKKILEVGGSIDILLKNKKTGKLAIYDIKTIRNTITEDHKIKWSLQQSLYKQILEKGYGAVVESIEITPTALIDIKTKDGKYPSPQNAGGTTIYTEENGQLYANGEEYKDASVKMLDNISLEESILSIQYRRLPKSTQDRVRLLEKDDYSTFNDKDSNIIVQEAEVKAEEDINTTGTKSIDELRNNKEPDTFIGIISSDKYGDRVLDLLEDKYRDLPEDLQEIEEFLQSKNISTVGIKNVENWIKEIEECKV